MKYGKYYLIALLVILIDQAVKLAVHYNMEMGLPGEIKIFGDWFKLHYTLNPGMAFGVELGSDYGKVILTLFRLVAMFGIGYYLYHLVKTRAHTGFIWCIALILGGAIGNLIDRVYFGVVTDFVLWRYQTKEWPVFNVADVALVVGVGLMFVDIWTEGKREKLLKAQKKA